MAIKSSFTMPVAVSFGDCDQARIVFYPNYFRWFDATYHAFLKAHGVDQRLICEVLSSEGTGLLEAGATFRSPASSGDVLDISVAVTDWSEKVFRLSYHGRRSGQLVVDGFEVRGLFMREDGRLRAGSVAALKALLEERSRDGHGE